MKKILLIAVLAFAFYFVASPYQNCLRTEGVSIFHRITGQADFDPHGMRDPDNVKHYKGLCAERTDW